MMTLDLPTIDELGDCGDIDGGDDHCCGKTETA